MKTAILATSLVFLMLGMFIVFFIVFHKRKQNRNREEKQRMQLSFQQEILQTQLEIQEQTFKTISQEIHDNIGQMLSLAKLNLNRVNFEKSGNEEKINDAKELISKSIQDLRDLSRTLNTETITALGLLKSIEMELQMVHKTGEIETHFDQEGAPFRLDPQKELILFRIYQEALHNIIKHAHASVVQVLVLFNTNSFELMITDNGHGFDAALENNAGSGLRNMKSRSRLIGASFKIYSTPGNGTRIHISLSVN